MNVAQLWYKWADRFLGLDVSLDGVKYKAPYSAIFICYMHT